MRDSKFFLSDYGSTNGTFVGEFPDTASRQVRAGMEVMISDGQLIMFGDVECTLSAQDGGEIVKAAIPGKKPVEHVEDDEPEQVRQGPKQTEDPQPDVPVNTGGQGPAIDYDEIRKIIREEVNAATEAQNSNYPALQSLHSPNTKRAIETARSGLESPTRVPSGGNQSPLRSPLRSPGHRSPMVQFEDGNKPGSTQRSTLQESEGDIFTPDSTYPAVEHSHTGVQPPKANNDVDEEVRLAEELAHLEAHVNEQVNEVRETLGVEARKEDETVPSRRKGFLARQEQRKQQILAIAKKHYRKQAPFNEFGQHLLPTGRSLGRSDPRLLSSSCTEARAISAVQP